jgi:hypothetical protein
MELAWFFKLVKAWTNARPGEHTVKHIGPTHNMRDVGKIVLTVMCKLNLRGYALSKFRRDLARVNHIDCSAAFLERCNTDVVYTGD